MLSDCRRDGPPGGRVDSITRVTVIHVGDQVGYKVAYRGKGKAGGWVWHIAYGEVRSIHRKTMSILCNGLQRLDYVPIERIFAVPREDDR
jgi:hypothetical protein